MKKLFLGIVILIGFILRVSYLDKFPFGFTPDEASFGYDAYSILKTGKDQWGNLMPLTLQSFGDYKSPLYSYIDIPFVAVMGLSKVSVRLPNALLGTLAIFITFLLTKELIESDALGKEIKKRKDFIALSSAFLFSVSPWSIMMSRGAFEANLTTLLLPLALYFFIKGLKTPKYLLYSSIFIGLNVFSYHSAKFVTPLVFITAIILFWNELRSGFGIYHKVALGILVIFIGLFFIGLKQGSSTRVLNVSIFNTSLLEASSERIKAINGGMDPVLARLIYNKYQAGIRHFFTNYITYFSPQFYFSQGPAESTYGMIPGRGVLYWFELPLLILGTLLIFKKLSRMVFVVITWLMLAPIPAAMSIGPGYAANRAVIMLPGFQIICALGFYYLVNKLDNFKYKVYLPSFYAVVVSIFFSYFIFDYFVISPQKTASGMLYGNYEAAMYLAKNYTNDNIIVSRSLSEPHIYIAFANMWDPKDYQKNTKNWDYKKLGLSWVDQMSEYSLGNYTFGDIKNEKYLGQNVILAGKPENFPKLSKYSKEFLYPNGEVAVAILNAKNSVYAYEVR